MMTEINFPQERCEVFTVGNARQDAIEIAFNGIRYTVQDKAAMPCSVVVVNNWICQWRACYEIFPALFGGHHLAIGAGAFLREASPGFSSEHSE